jgi:hypothetical protein
MLREVLFNWGRCAGVSKSRLPVSTSKLKEIKLRGLSPRANYTGQATEACRRSYCQLLWIEGVAWSARRIPHGRNLGFLDTSRYFSIK